MNQSYINYLQRFTQVASTASFTRPNDTNAYSIGDVVSDSTSSPTVMTFSAVSQNPNTSVTIVGVSLRIDVSSVPAGMGIFRLHLYNASPTAINDNSAFDLIAADRSKYLGFIDISTPEDFGSTLWAEVDNINFYCKLATGSTTLYGILETRAAFTPTAQAVKNITLKAIGA